MRTSHCGFASDLSERNADRSSRLVAGSAPNSAGRLGVLLVFRNCLSSDVTAESTGFAFAIRLPVLAVMKSAIDVDR